MFNGFYLLIMSLVLCSVNGVAVSRIIAVSNVHL